MNRNNVYSTAKVISKNDDIENYQLGTFVQNDSGETQQVYTPAPITPSVNHPNPSLELDNILGEIKALNTQVQQVNQKITNIENNGMTTKEIDAQVVQAIKDLKKLCKFF